MVSSLFSSRFLETDKSQSKRVYHLVFFFFFFSGRQLCFSVHLNPPAVTTFLLVFLTFPPLLSFSRFGPTVGRLFHTLTPVCLYPSLLFFWFQCRLAPQLPPLAFTRRIVWLFSAVHVCVCNTRTCLCDCKCAPSTHVSSFRVGGGHSDSQKALTYYLSGGAQRRSCF